MTRLKRYTSTFSARDLVVAWLRIHSTISPIRRLRLKLSRQSRTSLDSEKHLDWSFRRTFARLIAALSLERHQLTTRWTPPATAPRSICSSFPQTTRTLEPIELLESDLCDPLRACLRRWLTSTIGRKLSDLTSILALRCLPSRALPAATFSLWPRTPWSATSFVSRLQSQTFDRRRRPQLRVRASPRFYRQSWRPRTLTPPEWCQTAAFLSRAVTLPRTKYTVEWRRYIWSN